MAPLFLLPAGAVGECPTCSTQLIQGRERGQGCQLDTCVVGLGGRVFARLGPTPQQRWPYTTTENGTNLNVLPCPHHGGAGKHTVSLLHTGTGTATATPARALRACAIPFAGQARGVCVWGRGCAGFCQTTTSKGRRQRLQGRTQGASCTALRVSWKNWAISGGSNQPNGVWWWCFV